MCFVLSFIRSFGSSTKLNYVNHSDISICSDVKPLLNANDSTILFSYETESNVGKLGRKVQSGCLGFCIWLIDNKLSLYLGILCLIKSR
jgi:hypothetical protein